MRKLTIVMEAEFREVLENGQVIRHINNMEVYKSSDQWKVTGAVILNNFGRVTERLSLTDLFDRLAGPNKIDLFYKNGKPKFRITDLDPGTRRIWRECPSFSHRWIVIDSVKKAV